MAVVPVNLTWDIHGHPTEYGIKADGFHYHMVLAMLVPEHNIYAWNRNTSMITFQKLFHVAGISQPTSYLSN